MCKLKEAVILFLFKIIFLDRSNWSSKKKKSLHITSVWSNIWNMIQIQLVIQKCTVHTVFLSNKYKNRSVKPQSNG